MGHDDDDPPGLNPGVVTAARRYNGMLGGKDNFEVDRTAAGILADIFPQARFAAVENRKFNGRVVAYLAAERGIRQFLDIGCGLPADPNTHEVAQKIDPTCRVLYVDNDLLTCVHGRALLTYRGDAMYGRTDCLCGDLRQSDDLLHHPELPDTLDLRQPVGVLISAVLQFITDDENPYQAVAVLMQGMASGSYLALTHGTGDFMAPEQIAAFDALDRNTHGPMVGRSHEQILQFFDRLDLIEPGLVPTATWRQAEADAHAGRNSAAYAGLAVKP